MNDSFVSIDNLASNKVGNDNDGFMERQQLSYEEVLQGMLNACAVIKKMNIEPSSLYAVKVNDCGMFEIRKYCHLHSYSHNVLMSPRKIIDKLL